MKAIDRKLVRDLGRLKGQVITIALVVACGISQLVAFVAFYRSLEASRAAFFSATRFGDLFVHLDRAPRSLLGRLAEIPGVARVDGRVVSDFRLDIPGVAEPVLGRFISLDENPDSRLDTLLLKEGRNVEPGDGREVVVSELFAEAHDLHPGDSVVAVLDGREVRLRICGVGVSAEYIYSSNPRTGFPDPSHFGIFWMDGKALSTALGLYGAFDDAVMTFSANAHPADIVAAVDRLLEPYGGTGAVLRDRQPSAYALSAKIDQYRAMAKFVPLFFLGVAAFILNLVLSRIIGTQREQIATLKALGYGPGALARHYLTFALVICGLGGVLGVGLGILEGEGGLHALIRYFNLPVLIFELGPSSVAIGVLASLAAGTAGAFVAVRRTIRLPAAEAMQPEPPESFKPTVIERLRLDRLFGVAGRMVLRDVERHPLRLGFSALAVALGTSILLVGTTMIDSLNRALQIQFTRIETEDLNLGFDRPRSAEALRDLQHVPGVLVGEAERSVPVRLRSKWRSRDGSIVGVPPNATLRPPRDLSGLPFHVSEGGLTLSQPLAKILGVRAGDPVEVDVLEAGRKHLSLPVAGFVEDFAGLNAYMSLPELDRRLGEPPTISGALLSVDRLAFPEVTRRLERLPAVASFDEPALDRKGFESEISSSFKALSVILALFASIIAIGIVFNNARIALAVRSRDLATLRILGFTRGEVATVLLGEQAVQLVLGVALGLPLGCLMGAATMASIPPEFFRAPAVFLPSSLIAAAAVVLFSGFGCALLVRREADRLDLVEVLKARD
ncbi:MAG TPA: FtsX-like permease family protein [Myxococcales bacterium]|nr:FtsX-like permease family protein [Myxococcales bacterium]